MARWLGPHPPPSYPQRSLFFSLKPVPLSLHVRHAWGRSEVCGFLRIFLQSLAMGNCGLCRRLRLRRGKCHLQQFQRSWTENIYICEYILYIMSVDNKLGIYFLFSFIHWCHHRGILPDTYFDRSTGLIRSYCVVYAMLYRSIYM